MFFHLCPSTSDLFGSQWEWDDPATRFVARRCALRFVAPCQALGVQHQGTLEVPCQSSGLEDEFQLNIGDFQGRTVNLPESEGIVHIELNIYIGVELFLQI